MIGTVSDKLSNLPIADATVSVNGKVVVTNLDGAFKLAVPEASRYVVNVRKLGYALLSQAFYGPTTGLQLRLDPAHRQICDPTATCRVLDESRQTLAGVEIAANTLVDSKGNLATVPLNVDVHGYDLSQPNPIPGDGAATDRTGRDATMVPFAAMNVDITDASGQRYTLAPGKTALVHMQVAPLQLPSAPATIPLWEYDEQTGYWHEKGQATLNGNAYEGPVPSFSAWNADTASIISPSERGRGVTPSRRLTTTPTPG